jgi:hypothetical protein
MVSALLNLGTSLIFFVCSFACLELVAEMPNGFEASEALPPGHGKEGHSDFFAFGINVKISLTRWLPAAFSVRLYPMLNTHKDKELKRAGLQGRCTGADAQCPARHVANRYFWPDCGPSLTIGPCP